MTPEPNQHVVELQGMREGRRCCAHSKRRIKPGSHLSAYLLGCSHLAQYLSTTAQNTLNTASSSCGSLARPSTSGTAVTSGGPSSARCRARGRQPPVREQLIGGHPPGGRSPLQKRDRQVAPHKVASKHKIGVRGAHPGSCAPRPQTDERAVTFDQQLFSHHSEISCFRVDAGEFGTQPGLRSVASRAIPLKPVGSMLQYRGRRVTRFRVTRSGLDVRCSQMSGALTRRLMSR